jgi:hypothetical protein
VALQNAISLRLTSEHHDALRRRAARLGITTSNAARQLLELGVVLDGAEEFGIAVTGEARKLMADQVGMAHVQFAIGLEPEDAGVVADDLSERELDSIAEGAPLLLTVEQLAAIRRHRLS